jgi:hypothetical protein
LLFYCSLVAVLWLSSCCDLALLLLSPCSHLALLLHTLLPSVSGGGCNSHQWRCWLQSTRWRLMSYGPAWIA